MSSLNNRECSDAKFAERLRRQADDGHHWDQVPEMLRIAAERIERLIGKSVPQKGLDYVESAVAVHGALCESQERHLDSMPQRGPDSTVDAVTKP
jgi:hypothetical protein